MMTMKLSRNEPEEAHLKGALDVSTNMTPVQSGCSVISNGRGSESVQAEMKGFWWELRMKCCAVVGSLSVARDGRTCRSHSQDLGGFSSCLTNHSGTTTVSDMMLEMSYLRRGGRNAVGQHEKDVEQIKVGGFI